MSRRAYFGAGWWIVHETDRELVLKKEDYLYRKMTGEDGFIKIAVQPGLSKDELYKQAERRVFDNENGMAELIAKDVLPNFTRYKLKAMPLNRAFETPESIRMIGRKRV